MMDVVVRLSPEEATMLANHLCAGDLFHSPELTRIGERVRAHVLATEIMRRRDEEELARIGGAIIRRKQQQEHTDA